MGEEIGIELEIGIERDRRKHSYLRTSTLSLYAIPTARETKFVMGNAWTLYKVRVLETFLTKCTF